MVSIGDGQLSFPSVRIGLSDDIKGNFVRLPGSIVQMLESTPIPVQNFGIETSYKGRHLYLGWDGHESLQLLNGQSVVQINPTVAAIHGLRGGEEVTINVKLFDDSLIATEVYIDPETSDDWEIIESNAQFFQDQILHQTRIVSKNQTLVCYVEEIVAKFNVQKIIPENLSFARLTTDSLIIVKPRENRIRTANEKAPQSLSAFSIQKPELTRSLLRKNDMAGFQLQMHPQCIKSSLAFVSVISNPIESEKKTSDADDKTAVEVAKKIVVEILSNKEIPLNHVVISDLCRQALNLVANNGEKIQVEFVDQNDEAIAPIVIAHKVKHSTEPSNILIKGDMDNSTNESIENFMTSMNDIIITDKTFLSGKDIYLELFTKSGNRVPFHRWKSEEITWRYSPDDVTVLEPIRYAQPVKPDTAIGVDSVLEEMLDYVTSPIVSSSGSLLHGSSGMGKTLLLQNLSYRLLSESPHYVKYVDCQQIAESGSFPKMKQLVLKWCSICYWHKPSLLILDNAETIFPSTKSEEEAPAGSAFDASSVKLCQLFISAVENINRKNWASMRVLLSAKNKDSLNQMLFSNHFVGTYWHLKPPQRDQRSDILLDLLDRKKLLLASNVDITSLSIETEGFSPRDIALLSDKIFCLHISAHEDETEPLVKTTFDEAIKGFTPSSLKGIKLQKNTGVKWSSIGALQKAKTLLLETLEWPTKYAPVFAKCPLRLRSGILLYGYPGCGKTMLASAVAQQCSLNFISVKGPEILNKYIGASEQSVREIFERAQAAKPCVLFFDEFDSIAPKRGHDSIGVTDRVVNQMLTQMDGAEGLDGVYVLAATSRPDLIDSALLRPGRLDKSILCGIPNETERLQILNAVTTSGDMNMESDCDLSQVARETHGFSGADLQGLCYNAYLKAVHRTLNSHASKSDSFEDSQGDPESDMRYTLLSDNAAPPHDFIERVRERYTQSVSERTVSGSTPVVITLNDFIEASAETKPSISASEFQKLSEIYGKFANDRDGEMRSGEASNEIGGRTTLM
ncbi:LAFE_0C11650g1_1 [Lachancea fermentati]|uniref:Peroxisomal ATPase PEX1 n=1 Tax=Lachancea fermentati TaxID=4955 RepID=A0A1G4MA81_LACFM|nr:LAFE_0C11650g1_1 [Lachancea fermentati]